jgi:simple sugar transport system substrate-binding protein
MRRRYIGVIAVALLATVLAACGGQDEAAGGDAARDEQLRVGMVLKDNVFEFWRDIEAGARRVAADANVELMVDSPQEEDAVAQIAKVEAMMTRQVDALVVAPSGPQLRPALQRAVDRGIEVVLVDTDIPGWTGKTSLIATDNVESSKAAVTAMVEQLGGSGQIAVIADPGVPVLKLRMDGAEQAVKGTDVEIVQTARNDCDIETAQNVTEDLLRAQRDLDGIFAACAGNAIGAGQALRSSGTAPEDMLIFGHDGFQIELQEIENGLIDGTVKQLPVKMGELAMQTISAAARGERVEPEIEVPFTIVTEENLDEFLNE